MLLLFFFFWWAGTFHTHNNPHKHTSTEKESAESVDWWLLTKLMIDFGV
jgi:hypothetical protein